VSLLQINMNTDVRLVGVNEHMVRNGLLLGVADWVHKCSGKLQVIDNQFLLPSTIKLLLSDNLKSQSLKTILMIILTRLVDSIHSKHALF